MNIVTQSRDHEHAGNPSWLEFLQSKIDPSWRPTEYDHSRLSFVPDPNNPHTLIKKCEKAGCETMIEGHTLCSACMKHWKLARADQGEVDYSAWAALPRTWARAAGACAIRGCGKKQTAWTLCSAHASTFRSARARAGASAEFTLSSWLETRGTIDNTNASRCAWASCIWPAEGNADLCSQHSNDFRNWKRRHSIPLATVDEFLAVKLPEPLLDEESGTTYKSKVALPLALLPEPLRSELIHALQQRDLHGRAAWRSFDIRRLFKALRRNNLVTLVGQQNLGLELGSDADRLGLARDLQRHIDSAHRQWSGVDPRNPLILYLAELNLTRHSSKLGPEARIDLSGLEEPWIAQTAVHWARAGQRVADSVTQVGYASAVMSEVLKQRGTPRHALSNVDLDAIVAVVQERWSTLAMQRKVIRAISSIIEFGRRDAGTKELWDAVPLGFSVDAERHRPQGSPPRSEYDESFRYIPSPIVDWVLDHLHLIDRGDTYRTAEARMMIFLQERCGRRTGETTRLLDDCIQFDSTGAPYLKWTSGKKPWGPGKPIPLHQETLDVIRDWQRIKREHGVSSRWLFPSIKGIKDQPYGTGFIATRFREFMAVLKERAPYPSEAEGVDGNLFQFDLATIDPYAFRHAFAQRLADATDEHGRQTFSPETLKAYMGHRDYSTTMTYFSITSKRMKKALNSLPPRRVTIDGRVISVDLQREPFNKLASNLGSCTEPQNVAAGGADCSVNYACESCPFFIVDPLERDAMAAKRSHLKMQYERARAINAREHVLTHLLGRIEYSGRIIAAIDQYIDQLPQEERDTMRSALDDMAEIRTRASAPRRIDLRGILTEVAA